MINTEYKSLILKFSPEEDYLFMYSVYLPHQEQWRDVQVLAVHQQ